MLKTVIIAENSLDPTTWETVEVEDLREFCMARFSTWPDTARIYHEQVAENCDVTPSDEWGVNRLGTLEGTFYIVVYPGDPVTIIIAVIAVAAAAAAAFLLRPSIPNTALRNTQQTSPNNELSDRQNSPRIGGRIPDIFGTVRATPDLIQVPYKTFVNHQEVEFCYMCVGRGEYSVADVRDDTTPIATIPGTSVEIYAPYTSPQSGDDPQILIGDPIDEPLWRVERLSAVNGQTLAPADARNFNGAANVSFSSPNKVNLNPSSAMDFTTIFAAGMFLEINGAFVDSPLGTPGISETRNAYFTTEDEIVFSGSLSASYVAGASITIARAVFSTMDGVIFDLSGTYTIYSVTGTNVKLVSPSSINGDWANVTEDTDIKSCDFSVAAGPILMSLDGGYLISSVTSKQIVLISPSSINSNWSLIASLPGSTTNEVSPLLKTTAGQTIGPFVIDTPTTSYVYVNAVAANGMYKDDGNQQYAAYVTVALGVQMLDEDGEAVGSEIITSGTIEGSAITHDTRALTIKYALPYPGRCRVRMYRVTGADTGFKGTVSDEVKWRDLYGMSPVTETHFGNVTTLASKTYATTGALAIKDRKLNLLATRKIPLRLIDQTFTVDKYPTNRADEIISFICKDQFIGRRSDDEIDYENIYDTLVEVEEYFGIEDVVEFNYTFDKDGMSFEETISAIASAVFCNAYRRGNVIKLSFEKETDDSTLLFNHRNKLPGTEQRTIRFGNADDNDGVEYEYVDPSDDAVVTFYLPLDRSAVNPKKIETIGIRSIYQAYFHAWRIWNKMRYQHVAVDFEATQEADLLVIQDRILVADNTRPDTLDGEVSGQNGLELILSQNATFNEDVEYSIFIQHVDGTTESIEITPGSAANRVVLAHAPKAPLALEKELYARATFIIVGSDNTREKAFLVTEKEPQSNFTTQVNAINYDARYYNKDKSYINGEMDW